MTLIFRTTVSLRAKPCSGRQKFILQRKKTFSFICDCQQLKIAPIFLRLRIFQTRQSSKSSRGSGISVAKYDSKYVNNVSLPRPGINIEALKLLRRRGRGRSEVIRGGRLQITEATCVDERWLATKRIMFFGGTKHIIFVGQVRNLVVLFPRHLCSFFQSYRCDMLEWNVICTEERIGSSSLRESAN